MCQKHKQAVSLWHVCLFCHDCDLFHVMVDVRDQRGQAPVVPFVQDTSHSQDLASLSRTQITDVLGVCGVPLWEPEES